MHPVTERVSENFQPEALAHARSQTWRALQTIAARIKVGMLEATAQNIAAEVLKEMGVARYWHKTHVRMGVNTQKSFSEASLPGVRLQPNDIYFLDLGPVFDGYEGDAGATFTVGSDAEMVRAAGDVKWIFETVQARWRSHAESGASLLRFAEQTAQRRGWKLYQPGSPGHRISDFPHRLYHTGTLEQLETAPAADRWVLEVHLHHPVRRFGAFYEDILSVQ